MRLRKLITVRDAQIVRIGVKIDFGPIAHELLVVNCTTFSPTINLALVMILLYILTPVDSFLLVKSVDTRSQWVIIINLLIVGESLNSLSGMMSPSDNRPNVVI